MSDLILKNKRQVRQSLRSVSRPMEEPVDGRTTWGLLYKRTFQEFIKTYDVPRRFNHFRGGPPDRRKRITIPLGYLGDHPIVGYIGSDGFIADREE